MGASEHGGAASSSATGIGRAPSLAGGSRDAKKPRLRLQESLRKRAHEDTPEESPTPAIVEEGELRSERKRARGPAAIFERPSPQEVAALAWVHDHLDDERAPSISKDTEAWSAELTRVQQTQLAKKKPGFPSLAPG